MRLLHRRPRPVDRRSHVRYAVFSIMLDGYFLARTTPACARHKLVLAVSKIFFRPRGKVVVVYLLISKIAGK